MDSPTGYSIRKFRTRLINSTCRCCSANLKQQSCVLGRKELLYLIAYHVTFVESQGQTFRFAFQALLDLVWPFGKCVRFFSPPSCTHSCAVAERSKEKWMDLVYLGGGALRNLYGGFNSRFLLLIVLFQNK